MIKKHLIKENTIPWGETNRDFVQSQHINITISLKVSDREIPRNIYEKLIISQMVRL